MKTISKTRNREIQVAINCDPEYEIEITSLQFHENVTIWLTKEEAVKLTEYLLKVLFI